MKITVEPPSDDSPRESLPRTLGRYRLLQSIGEGGMGQVYLAEQREGVRRRVAVKILRRGIDTRQVLARFEAERHALARMNHPNVARILDAGETPRGRPYFVLEYVPGTPITEYCDQKQLSTRGRLRLFQQVCAGIQHAHQKGIIHRDIKPANVLVTEESGDEPLAKIIDFGVARAVDRELTARTLVTVHGQILGTPEYMSPEQAGLAGQDVDARTDVYSLGVLLYELLTGQLPFDPRVLRERGYAEVQRIIREDEPARPSTRLSSLGEGNNRVAELRGTTLHHLLDEVRRDLDWITLKAMAKERLERYVDPSDLSRDIRRFLASEPVRARPHSVGYRLRKFARRHRTLVGTVSTTLVILLVGLGATWQLYRQAVDERARADRNARAILRLSDLKRLADLEQHARELWPADLSWIPEYETWLEQASALRDRRPQHEEAIRQLKSRGRFDPRGKSWIFASDEEQWRFHRLEELLRGVDTLFDADPLTGAATSIGRRLELAQELELRTLSGAEARRRWRQHGDRIRTIYGFAVDPQYGLLPLGENEQGLYEFWHLASGREPQRNPNPGHPNPWVIDEHAGMVLVLLPGGETTQGVEVPFHFPTGSQQPVIERVNRGSLADELGLEVGDRVVSLAGRSISDVASLKQACEALDPGDRFAIVVERQGGRRKLEGRYRAYLDPYAQHYEGPAVPLELDPYFISKYEVTQEQWVRVMGVNPSRHKKTHHWLRHGDSWRVEVIDQALPVEWVSVEDCSEMLRRLDLRVPWEREWEHAARAGQGTIWTTGNDRRRFLEGAHGNIADGDLLDLLPTPEIGKEVYQVVIGREDGGWDGYLLAAPVGSFPPNRFGLHDIGGNSLEICLNDRDAHLGYPATGRDGGFIHALVSTRLATRIHYKPGQQFFAGGVRPVRDLR